MVFKGFCHCCLRAEEKGAFFVIRGFMETPRCVPFIGEARHTKQPRANAFPPATGKINKWRNAGTAAVVIPRQGSSEDGLAG